MTKTHLNLYSKLSLNSIFNRLTCTQKNSFDFNLEQQFKLIINLNNILHQKGGMHIFLTL